MLYLYLQILFENRKKSGSLNDCLVSVDGTDLRIPQQGPARKGNPFSSHKYKGKSALRYELAVDIKTGYLVWINGPFPAGAFPDVTIFRSCLAEELDEDERVEADDGYIGEAPHKVKCPGGVSNQKEKEHMQACTRMRQETINMRIKQWEICKQTYRHDITQHGYVFRAVAVIVQIAIENGEPLFEVDYSDLY